MNCMNRAVFTVAVVLAMDKVFELSPSEILNLHTVHSRRTAKSSFQPRTAENTRDEIDKSTTKWRLGRFCDMCRSCNIDPMNNTSIQTLFITMSKIPNKQHVMELFSGQQEGAKDEVDWDSLQNTSTFCEPNDWITILNYVEFDVQCESIHENETLLRFTDALIKGGLDTEYSCTIEFRLLLLLHAWIQNISSAKILEQKLSTMNTGDTKSVCKDIELRCLRCISAFSNDHIEDGLVAQSMLHVIKLIRIRKEFQMDILNVLRSREELSLNSISIDQKENGRLKLRTLARNIHRTDGMVYSSTFDSWATQQKFSVATNRRLQLFLYFVKTQVNKVHTNTIKNLFSQNILRKIDGQSVDHIDHRAITSVIGSIRLYSHNISSLIDFRTNCLHGINQSHRKTLSMAQILQLYICCYQHESIREICWQKIVPVWNFTIENAISKFREDHVYEVDAVVRCIMQCMLHKLNFRGEDHNNDMDHDKEFCAQQEEHQKTDQTTDNRSEPGHKIKEDVADDERLSENREHIIVSVTENVSTHFDASVV